MENKLIYENNIVEINKIYTNALIKILAPILFEGLVSIYKRSKDLFSENENDKITLEDIFKICLKDVSNLNNYILTKELERIKEASKSSGYFDNLLKSVVKSYIILLTYNLSKKECVLIEEKEHEKIDSVKFIHICYIELARNIFRNPKSFIDYIEENNINDEDFDDEYNGKYIKMIEDVIQKALYKILPFEKIVNDYLKSDYVKKIDNDEEKKLQDELVNKITNNILEKVILKQKLLNNIDYTKEPNKLTEQFSDYKEDKQNDSYLQEYRNILMNGGNDDINDKELNKVEEFQINQSNQQNTNQLKDNDDEEDKLLKQVLNIGSNNQSNPNQSNHLNQSNQINQSNQSNQTNQINQIKQTNQSQINNQSNNQQTNNQQTQTKTQLDEQIEKEINEQKQLSQQTQHNTNNQQTQQNFTDYIN